VYISDRRGNFLPTGRPSALASLSPSTHETGENGYFDLVNSGDIKAARITRSSPSLLPGDLQLKIPAGSGVLPTYGENTFPAALVDSTGVPTLTTIF